VEGVGRVVSAADSILFLKDSVKIPQYQHLVVSGTGNRRRLGDMLVYLLPYG
jgi:hypothetical protein